MDWTEIYCHNKMIAKKHHEPTPKLGVCGIPAQPWIHLPTHPRSIPWSQITAAPAEQLQFIVPFNIKEKKRNVKKKKNKILIFLTRIILDFILQLYFAIGFLSLIR